jgi:transcriptional regulator with XRE-family HTH domain
MPALKEARQLRHISEVYASSPSSTPGIALDPPMLDRTHIGTPTPSDIPLSEQLRFLNVLSECLANFVFARHESTGSNPLVILPVAETPSEKPAPRRHMPVPAFHEQVASIRSSLSLQMKELAQLVGVERPTVYSWLNQRNTPHAANRERLHALYRIARHWAQLSSAPLGKALHEVDADGESIFSLLAQTPLPVSAVRARLAHAAERAAETAPRRGTSVRELAAKHGIDLRRVADRQDDIDIETGKGVLPE